MNNREFTIAMNFVFDKAFEYDNDEIQEDVVDWFGSTSKDVDDDDFYVYDETGMWYLLRDLMNYDWFWINDDGMLDVENANMPDVAEVVQPFVTKELALSVRRSFDR